MREVSLVDFCSIAQYNFIVVKDCDENTIIEEDFNTDLFNNFVASHPNLNVQYIEVTKDGHINVILYVKKDEVEEYAG